MKRYIFFMFFVISITADKILACDNCDPRKEELDKAFESWRKLCARFDAEGIEREAKLLLRNARERYTYKSRLFHEVPLEQLEKFMKRGVMNQVSPKTQAALRLELADLYADLDVTDKFPQAISLYAQIMADPDQGIRAELKGRAERGLKKLFKKIPSVPYRHPKNSN